MKQLLALIILSFGITFNSFSQNVGVGTTTPTHTFHVVPSTTNDPVRIEGVNVFISETNLLAIDTATGVIRYMPISSMVGNINFDSIVIQNLLTNGDTLLYNTTFVDSLIALMRDSVDTDVDSLTLVGDTLSVYENMKKFSVSLASLGVDSTFIDSLLSSTYFTDSIYAFVSDSLLRDSLWLDSLKKLIDTDIDSAIYANDTLTIFEDSSIVRVEINPNKRIILAYDSIKTLSDSGWLIPGKQYVVSDFQTLHIVPNDVATNDAVATIPVEPLLLTAINDSTFSSRAISLSFPEDIIEYTLDNAYLTTLEHPNGKGVITYRKRNIWNFYTNKYQILEAKFDFLNAYFGTWHTDSIASYTGDGTLVDLPLMWTPNNITIGSTRTPGSAIGVTLGSNGNVTYSTVFGNHGIDTVSTFGGLILGSIHNNLVFFSYEKYWHAQGDWSKFSNVRSHGVAETKLFGDELYGVTTGKNIISYDITYAYGGEGSRIVLDAQESVNILNLGEYFGVAGGVFRNVSFVPEYPTVDFWDTRAHLYTPSIVDNLCLDGLAAPGTGRGFGNTTHFQVFDNVYNLKWQGGIKTPNANRFNTIKNIFNLNNTSYTLTSNETDGSYIDGKTFNSIRRSITPTAGVITIGYDNSITGLFEVPAGDSLMTLNDMTMFGNHRSNMDRAFECLGNFTLKAGGNIQLTADKNYVAGDIFVLRKFFNKWVLISQ